MKKAFLILLAGAAILASCKNRQTPTTVNQQADSVSTTDSLTAYISAPQAGISKDSVVIVFTVKNSTAKPQKFCKWETPFEPMLGKYFEVTDEQGTETSFRGAMARRVMPPPASAYIQVPAGDSVKVNYNIAKTYAITKPGTYKIKYSGTGVSGLKAGNEISINIP